MSNTLGQLIETLISEHNLAHTLKLFSTPPKFVFAVDWWLVLRIRKLAPDIWSEILTAPALRRGLLRNVDIVVAETDRREIPRDNKKTEGKARLEGISKTDFEMYVARTLALLIFEQLVHPQHV
jgi:hypothetical protein